jgi:DNA-directed RNA polymerase I, II, and III subunit RPABC2
MLDMFDLKSFPYYSAFGETPEEEEDNFEEEEDDFQKLKEETVQDYILEYHPECTIHNNDEVNRMCMVVRDNTNTIIDDNHRTLPILTKYERTRILGQRAKQINAGANAYIEIPEDVIDGYIIAQMELEAKKTPYIIRRPLPNGSFEYWKLSDLEQIDF